MPRSRAPLRVCDALRQTFLGITIATAGPLKPLGLHAIHDLAHSPDLVSAGVWSASNEHGLRLTDYESLECPRFAELSLAAELSKMLEHRPPRCSIAVLRESVRSYSDAVP